METPFRSVLSGLLQAAWVADNAGNTTIKVEIGNLPVPVVSLFLNRGQAVAVFYLIITDSGVAVGLLLEVWSTCSALPFFDFNVQTA